MNRYLFFTVPPRDDGKTVKDLIRRRFAVSTALLSVLKRKPDGITLNGSAVTVRKTVKPGDLLRLNVGDDADGGLPEGDAPLSVLYEDDDLIVLDKPPFVPVHPSAGHLTDTLANALSAYYHRRGETFVCRCVTRLDRNTSGAVLFAKNAYAHESLRRALSEGKLKKTYLALVHGEPLYSGTVNAPVYRPVPGQLLRTVDPRGQAAVTDYRLLRSDGLLSLVEVKPRTGRTHQIRVHFAHIGYPLVSDFLYGREDDGILSRHGLHCSSLSFPHPVTGKTVTVKSPLAADMAAQAALLPPRGRYTSLDGYLKEQYGVKLRRLLLTCGTTCPNREQGGRGCAFCSPAGAGEFAPPDGPVCEQIAAEKRRLRRGPYIAYFQPFTNTYAPFERMKERFSAAVADPEVKVLSVATRPDCLPAEVLDLLEELNRIKPVWVELGLQTARDDVAARFGRGYPTACYGENAARLRERGITVITHLIFGLPGETEDDMLASVRYISDKTDGVKFQMLQILRGSVWGEGDEWKRFPLLSEEAYADLVCSAISLLPPRVVIHRLTGDPPGEALLAPAWTKDKKAVLARISKTLEQKDLYQGKNISE